MYQKSPFGKKIALLKWILVHYTVQKMKFSIVDFFSKCDQIRSFLRIWSHLLKKSTMENFIFCAVFRFYLSHKFYNKNWTLFYPRWNVFFDPLKDEKDKHNHTNESDINVVNMNNYFGVGIGSELCLEFHLSREENPEKFNSRYVVIITQYLRKCIMYHRSDVASCF